MHWLQPFEHLRTPLVSTATPLEYHPTLSRELGVELFLKRDDMLDAYGSGNKIRKLEYILGHALARGADTLVTAGGPQSNQCKAVAHLARRFSLHSHLVFCGDELPHVPAGNYLVARLLGSSVTWVPSATWGRIRDHLAAAAAQERAAGRRPRVITPGASDWLGTLGYVRMAGELASQEFAGDTPFDHVVLPTGSGGTHVGLVVGARLLGRAWSVTGVCVLGDPAYFTALHRRILRELAFRARLPHKIRPEEIAVFSRDGGEMYDAYTVDDVRETIRVARDHGVIFEPVYMLKALNGLRALIQRGSIARGARVVLVHTGGLFSLLGTDDRISSAVAEFFTSEPLNLPGAGALQAPVG